MASINAGKLRVTNTHLVGNILIRQIPGRKRKAGSKDDADTDGDNSPSVRTMRRFRPSKQRTEIISSEENEANILEDDTGHVMAGGES